MIEQLVYFIISVFSGGFVVYVFDNVIGLVREYIDVAPEFISPVIFLWKLIIFVIIFGATLYALRTVQPVSPRSYLESLTEDDE
jgi:hypothetical protein